MTDDPDRVVGADAYADDRTGDRALRPLSFDDYVGQEQLVSNLKVFVHAARARGEAVDHMLFFGPPGLGKTTLAHIIAHEMAADILVTSGPAIERKGDLAGLLTNMKDRDVLFIDEIHRLNAVVEENLYPAMEDFRFDLIIGEGSYARSMTINLPPFTLIGATTRTGLMTSPMRDRFGIVSRLEYYDYPSLLRIVKRSAGILDIAIDQGGTEAIARRSRGTPRIANRLLRRVRDFAQVEGDGQIRADIAQYALERMRVDPAGLDAMDRAYLVALLEKFNGGPVGVETLAAALSENKGTLEDVYEPFLIQQGFIQRTARGRMGTLKAYRHLELAPPGNPSDPGQGSLI